MANIFDHEIVSLDCTHLSYSLEWLVWSHIGDYSPQALNNCFLHLNGRVITRRVNRTVTVPKLVCCNGYTNSSGGCVGKLN